MKQIEAIILKNQLTIENWFRKQWAKRQPLLTGSVDLRNAGFKIAPVDTNVFPAGFNNLNPDFYPLCIQALQATLSQQYPWCSKIILIPESHTRNPFYLENIAILLELIQNAGYEVRLGSLLELEKPMPIILPSGKTVTLEPLIRKNNIIGLKNFNPCIILLNNDLSDGLPELLKNTKQPITPSPLMGWFARSKTHHFEIYSKLSTEFAELINIDPWHITPLFDDCDDVDFLDLKNSHELVRKTTDLFKKIQQKYNQYHIKQKPYIAIKSDTGTYGMAVMMIQDPEEILHLNRKQRQHMSVGKSKQKITRVILQEGVPTIETLGRNHAVSEPVLYLIGQTVVGGFYRVHQNKGPKENLNAPGMHFEPWVFCEYCNNPDVSLTAEHPKNEFYAYSVIARIAHLAASLEL